MTDCERDMLLVVGYLVTHENGYEARLSADRTRAELYAARNHATIEPMYVRRRRSSDRPEQADEAAR